MKENEKKYNADYKKYNVTFETKNKYNPTTREVAVLSHDELSARYLVSEEFDSLTFNKKLHTFFPSGKHIKITKVKEVKGEKNND